MTALNLFSAKFNCIKQNEDVDTFLAYIKYLQFKKKKNGNWCLTIQILVLYVEKIFCALLINEPKVVF